MGHLLRRYCSRKCAEWPPLTSRSGLERRGLASPVGGFAGASGGGASATFPIPPYQSAASGSPKITDTNNNVSSNRFIPDVAGMVWLTGFYLERDSTN